MPPGDGDLSITGRVDTVSVHMESHTPSYSEYWPVMAYSGFLLGTLAPSKAELAKQRVFLQGKQYSASESHLATDD